MLIAIGFLLVFAAVLGGFVLERGNPLVLLQPAELLIIGGAALGIMLMANPPRNLRRIAAGLGQILRPRPYSREFYLDTLRMLYQLFGFIRRSTPVEVEKVIEGPAESPVFQSCPVFLADAGARAFVCDSFRLVLAAGTSAPEVDRIMQGDIAVESRGAGQPVAALASLADALPGLGIVAAVLGVVVTMQALGGPASEIGQKVAAALVGTFLGILLSYGLVAPLAVRLEWLNQNRSEYLQVLRIGIANYLGGAAPLVAAEFARRSIPADMRPSWEEMEDAFRRGARAEPALQVVNG